MWTRGSFLLACSLAACGGSTGRPLAASAPSPVPESAAAEEPIGRVGSDQASSLVASGRTGWAVVCEARQDSNGDGTLSFEITGYHTEGDEVRPYLVFGIGPGEPIDAHLASDESGRWIAVARGGSAWLVDARSARWEELGPTPVEPARDLAVHPFFSFGGGTFAYFTEPTGLVARELASGTVHRVPAHAGRLVDVRAEESGFVTTSWVEDSDHDGTFGMTGVVGHVLPEDHSPCASYGSDAIRMPSTRGDHVEHLLSWWTSDGTIRSVPAPISHWRAGDDLLVERDDGAFRLSAAGEAPVAEGLHLLAVSVDGGSWLAAGPWDAASSPLLYFHDGVRSETGLVRPDQWFEEGDLFVDADTRTMIDLRTGTRSALDGAAYELAGGWIRVEHDAGTTWIDAATGARREVADRGSLFGDHLLVGDWPVRVLDLRTGEDRGRIDGRVWNVTDDGRVLRSPGDTTPMERGPFEWVRPRAPSSSTAPIPAG